MVTRLCLRGFYILQRRTLCREICECPPEWFSKIKKPGPWPPQKDKHFSIFFFGSSTAFGYGVPDSETISSHVQELFPRRGFERVPVVYNFSRGHYYSTQERILFTQLLAKGSVPDMALFLDGLNEFLYGDGTLVSNRFERLLRGDVRKLFMRELRKRSSLLRALRDTRNRARRFFGKDIDAKKKDRYVAKPAELRQIIDRYMINKKLIEATGTACDVTTVFAWEPVPTYRYDLALHPFVKEGFGRLEYSGSGYHMMADYVKKHNPGDNFIWCADIGQDATQPLYVDLLHYSPRMSKMLAQTLCDVLETRHLIPGDKQKK